MDLKRYKYIQNTKPKYAGGKNNPLLQTPQGVTLPTPQSLSQMVANNVLSNNITNSIKNTPIDGSKLPIQPLKTMSNATNYVGMATNALQFAQSLGNAFSTKSLPTTNNLIADAGTTEGNVDGVSYEKVGSIDGDAAMDQVKSENTSNTLNATTQGMSTGAAVGSTFGPIGGAIGAGIGAIGGLIGGIFGGNKRKREMRRRIFNAKQRANYTNNYNMAGASTTALQNNYYEENPTGNNIIYADKGKDMKNKVWTPDGYQVGPTNSYVGKGESIIDYTNGTGTLVTKGNRGIDNQPSSVSATDDNVIIGNDKDWTNGIKFSDQAAPFTAQLQTLNKFNRAGRYNEKSSLSNTTKNVQDREINKLRGPIMDQLKNISDRQAIQHQIENKQALRGFKCGKDKFDDGSDNLSLIPKWWNPTMSTMSDIELPNQVVTETRRPLKWWNPAEDVLNISDGPINVEPYNGPMPTIVRSTPEETPTGNSTKPKFLRTSRPYASNIPWWQRLAPSLFGITQAYGQYRTYNDQPIRYNNTYKSNPYQGVALRGLNNLRYDIIPSLNAVRDAEARSNYAINNAGGLSGAQKYLARIANTAGTQRNLANVYATANEANNKYRAAYYDALNRAGEANRTARMQAAQNDYANYVAAHGAKYTNRDRAIANMINQVNNAYANEFKYRTWQDTLRMYNQDLNQDQLNFLSNLAQLGGRIQS